MNKTRWAKLSLILCCAGVALAEVKTDYDRQADFGKYHSYSWIKVKTEDPLWNDRITQAIDSQLTEKGWNKVPSGGDTSIAAYGSTKERRQINTFYDGFGGGWGYRRGFGRMGGMGTSTRTTQLIPIGTLMVDIFDTSDKKLIWRGSSSETLSNNSDKNIKKLNDEAKDMFKKFPPKAKE